MAEKEWASLADLLYPIGSYYYCEIDTPENQPSKFFGGEWTLTETYGIADPTWNWHSSLSDSGLSDVIANGNLRCYLRVG